VADETWMEFTGIEVDVRMLIYIRSERQGLIQFIMSRIEAWPACGLADATEECVQGPWHMALRKVVDENPTLAALSKHLYENRTCPACGRDITSINQSPINSLLAELESIEQIATPLPSWYTSMQV